AQIFEFADERFCQAQMPMLRVSSIRRIIVICVTNATAPSRHAARRVKRKVSAAGCKAQSTKITSVGRKIASVSKTGAKPIPAIGVKRSLRPKYRYKKSSKRKWLKMRSLSLERHRLRYKISSRYNRLSLWDLSP